jgi:Streptomycin adenylyltransferase
MGLPRATQLITDFLIGVPYVAKSLLRDELLPTKWVLDFDMRFNYLLPLLQWRVECDHDWSLKAGNLGKGLRAHLPTDTWSELEQTFSDATPTANWDALFDMIMLFGRVAREIAELLDYAYPERLVTRVNMPAACAMARSLPGHCSPIDGPFVTMSGPTGAWYRIARQDDSGSRSCRSVCRLGPSTTSACRFSSSIWRMNSRQRPHGETT